MARGRGTFDGGRRHLEQFYNQGLALGGILNSIGKEVIRDRGLRANKFSWRCEGRQRGPQLLIAIDQRMNFFLSNQLDTSFFSFPDRGCRSNSPVSNGLRELVCCPLSFPPLEKGEQNYKRKLRRG
jgi:hypothetical protein